MSQPPPIDPTAQSLLEELRSARALQSPDADGCGLLERAAEALAASLRAQHESSLRWQALFDAVPDPVSILAEDGTVLALNKAGVEAYQRDHGDIVGKNISVLNPDLPREHMVPVWETLNRGESYVIEVTNMRGDGTRFPVEVHSANYLFDGRKSLVAVARDLSRRREAETRYRELMEALDRGVIVHNRERQILYANGAALRIFSVNERMRLSDELAHDRWRVVDEDGQELEEHEMPPNRALAEGRMQESRLIGLYHRQRKELIWLSITSVPQFAPGENRPSQVTSIFSDVTHLKRESALFDRAQSLAQIGGWEWDTGRDLVYVTAEAYRILGAAQAPQRIADVLACLEDTDQRRFHDVTARVMRDGGGFDTELQGKRHDGQPFWVRVIGEVDSSDPASARVIGTLQDISLDKRSEEALRVQARTDPLTGLMNRDAVLTELGQRLSDPVRGQMALLYIDLDRFKAVNDVLGHNTGDQLLMEAAHRILGAVGPRGQVARFGGDEFLVLCEDGGERRVAEHMAEAILQAFEPAFRFGQEEFNIGASIGIAHAPHDGARPQQLIQNADVAMYDVKHRTRNAWQDFTPELAQKQQDRVLMETQLRRAVDNEEFHLVYQPQVDLRRGQIVAAEALIRWSNHQLGEQRPDLFIGHAETTGDIVRIGRWVLREACRQVRQWRDQGLGIIRVAVNVSYRQFADDLARHVRELLEEFDLPGSALELEFTERVLIEDAPATLRTFAELRALGVLLSIDDFGEGYSALNYLRRLPIHGLKISQLFTEGVPGNRSDVAVCQAVSAIARSLGLGLVAEGIESESQRQFLLQLGVPVGQGFLFAPGLPPDEFASRLRGTRLPRAAQA